MLRLLLFTPFSVTRFAMHRNHALHDFAPQFSGFLWTLFTKTPRGTLPVNSNLRFTSWPVTRFHDLTSNPNMSIPACKKVITFVLYYTHLRFFIARIFCRHISRLFDIYKITVLPVTKSYISTGWHLPFYKAPVSRACGIHSKTPGEMSPGAGHL